jgi:hypothetical protein|tara:strand:- start:1343 stop:1534 length:192 start_codon:yes stop_codon:yes gene_type:complete
MKDETAVYLVLKKIRTRKQELKDVIAMGLPSFDEYMKAVGEHKAYTIMEQEVQDLQKEEENNG